MQKEVISSNAIPGMTQSGGSDSSSFSDNAENEELDEWPAENEEPEKPDKWAADLVNAVSLDTSSRLVTKPRSHSIESDTSSDEGHEGRFWRTSPNSEEEGSWDGSVDQESESNEDEDSVTLSQTNSPSKEIFGLSIMHENRIKKNEKYLNQSPLLNDLGPVSNLQENTEIKALNTRVVPRMPVRVSFANINNMNLDLDSKNGIPRLSENDDDEKDFYVSSFKPLAKMGRSRSYSALSSSLTENQTNEENKSGKNTLFTQDQYREYFLKFVDLAVVREITAAAAARC